MQTVNDLLKVSLEALEKFIYYHKRVIVSQGEHYIKIRLYIDDNLFVQINRNEKSNLTNMVIIKNNNRIYGRDQYKENWHRHPAADPVSHNHSDEGRKPVTLEIFLDEADHILRQMGLV